MRNLKKVISSVAAIAIVASSASAFAVTFPDVDSSASYAKAVETLTALKIVNGDDKGLFNPDNNVTRAEFTKLAVGALGEIAAAEAQTTSQFTDAANTSQHWAAGYIAQGVADGFINGMGDGTFAPDAQVTYAQAAKMLVAAVGYTSYAEAAGGWPSGYVSQASSLDISKGVSASNDTALTRAQCATMIYNAMQVPLNVIKGWKTETTLTGTIQVPETEKLDGKGDRDYETLLTDKHDAYYVKGRVMKTSREGGLDNDQVSYQVEVSDNFDGYAYGNNELAPDEKEMRVGDTDAANMLFAYTEAIVQKDDDTDEFTIISITNYGNAKIVEFAADDVADDDTTIYKDYMGKHKMPVYKSSTTSSTTKYNLATDAKIYVNGVKEGLATNALIDLYILQNQTGTVTLVDETKTGSTTTDGDYDYIMVSYYVDAVVDYVQTSASSVKVYFKEHQCKASKLEWDPDDDKLDISFTKDGAQIAYTDLQEFDVLSIQYNIKEYGDKTDSLTSHNSDDQFFNVLVSNNVVEGSVTSRDTKDKTVTIGGNEYDIVEAIVGDIENDPKVAELGTTYTAYIDVFGYIAYLDEGSSEKNYGVIVAMYKSKGDDQPTVRLITSDAKVVAYECKDEDAAKKFYEYATGKTYVEGAEFTKSGNKAKIKAGETVCTYKLSGGKIRFDKAYVAQNAGNGEDLEYKANSSKIGSYSISDATTKIIDMDDYMKDGNSGSTVKTLSVSDFEDEAEYTAYFYDKNNDSVYRFAIVFAGTSSIRPETQIAVIKKSNGQQDSDTTTCSAYTVIKGGEEVEMLYEDKDSNYREGTVIAYTIGADGYVEDGDLYVLYTPDESYTLDTILAQEDFGKLLKNVSVETSGKNAGKYKIAYNGKTSGSKDVFAYVGIVYRKSGNNLEIFTKQNGGVSQVADTEDLSLGGANVYTFDYNERANKGARLSVGSTSQTTSVFNQAYINDKNAVQWNKLDGATPQIAFVKEVDGDVTDAVIYVAP